MVKSVLYPGPKNRSAAQIAHILVYSSPKHRTEARVVQILVYSNPKCRLGLARPISDTFQL
jgi:hypothetical protein